MLLEDEDPPYKPSTPDHTMEDDEVEALEIEYSTIPADSFVVSGPLEGRGAGPGRVFSSIQAATIWARRFYKQRLICRVPEAEPGGRWAFRVRKQ